MSATTRRASSHVAGCSFCGEQARPHTTYCLGCGQILGDAPNSASTFTAADVPTAGTSATVSSTRSTSPAQAQLVLMFADGRRHTVELPNNGHASSMIILGRAPSLLGVFPGAQRLSVPDPTMSVSRTHAIVELRGTEAVITDIGSSNGTAIERDGTRLGLASGRQCSLDNGDCLWLGKVAVEIRFM